MKYFRLFVIIYLIVGVGVYLLARRLGDKSVGISGILTWGWTWFGNMFRSKSRTMQAQTPLSQVIAPTPSLVSLGTNPPVG
jgi:hypothetical protein